MDAPQEEFISSESCPSHTDPQARPSTEPSPEIQRQPVILLPPTHEQSNPSFHVQGSLAKDFIRFLGKHDISAWEPVSKIPKLGTDHKRIVEIDIESDTPTDKLEALIKEFLEPYPFKTS